MIVVGLEGTAHTASVGIVDSEKILANVGSMYSPPTGGIHPREAANHHAARFPEIIKRAMKVANIRYCDIAAIAFSQGPGLGPCLRSTATAARVLALKLGVPLLGVNHCIAHLEIGRLLTGAVDPILLYVSGGNTQIITFNNGRYRICGETQDIGIGNMFDKFGRALGLRFPCGPAIERLASKGRRFIPLPYSVKGMDVAFSGLLTAALSLVGREKTEDLAYSLQEVAFSMLVEVTERAAAHLDKSEVLLSGGVAQNKRLQAMLKTMIEERGGNFYVPPAEYCVDNGAMIAYTGYLMIPFATGAKGLQNLTKEEVFFQVAASQIKQKYRTDEVDVAWRK